MTFNKLSSISSWTPPNYKTRNWSDFNHSLKQHGALSVWFDPDADWKAGPTGKRRPSRSKKI